MHHDVIADLLFPEGADLLVTVGHDRLQGLECTAVIPTYRLKQPFHSHLDVACSNTWGMWPPMVGIR